MRQAVESIMEKAIKQAEKMLNEDSLVSRLLDQAIEKLGTVSDSVYRVQDHFLALYRMLRAWVKGEYEDISPKTLVLALAALIYFVNPLDIIPDFIPFTGLLDDIAVLSYVAKTVNEEIEKFLTWEHERGMEAV